ncbi:MAG: hypothetical protein ACFB6S_16390 [Geminicoccaceae bacterium]
MAESAARAFEMAERTLRRIRVPRVTAASGRAGSLRLDEVRLGDATIGRITAQGFDATIDTEEALLDDFRVVLSLRAGISFRVFGRERNPAVRFNIPFDIGTVAIPDLENIAVTAPSAVITAAQIDIQPVSNLDVGAVQFDDLLVDDSLLPAAGFGLAGLALGPVSLTDLDLPASWTEAVSIGAVTLERPLILPTTLITDLELPSVAVPRVSSTAAILIPDVRPLDFQFRQNLVRLFGIRIAIFVEPTLTIRIGALRLDNVTASSSVEQLILEDIRAPLSVRGARLDELTLNQIRVERVGI